MAASRFAGLDRERIMSAFSYQLSEVSFFNENN
jgi:hypothetical protein